MSVQQDVNEEGAKEENWWPGQVLGIAGATKNLERIALELLEQHEKGELAEGIVVGAIISCAHNAGVALRMAIQSASRKSHQGLIHHGRLKKGYSRLREKHTTIEQEYQRGFNTDIAGIGESIDQRYLTKRSREEEKVRVGTLLAKWSTARQVIESTSKVDWRFSAEEPALAITSTYGLIGLHLTEDRQVFPGLVRKLAIVIARLYKDINE